MEALKYMAIQGISHRDLKPENLLLDNDFNLKIGDFGFSTTEIISTTKKGTPGYMSPEIHLGEKYNGTQADVFAAGVILFIMVSGHPPFLTS